MVSMVAEGENEDAESSLGVYPSIPGVTPALGGVDGGGDWEGQGKKSPPSSPATRSLGATFGAGLGVEEGYQANFDSATGSRPADTLTSFLGNAGMDPDADAATTASLTPPETKRQTDKVSGETDGGGGRGVGGGGDTNAHRRLSCRTNVYACKCPDISRFEASVVEQSQGSDKIRRAHVGLRRSPIWSCRFVDRGANFRALHYPCRLLYSLPVSRQQRVVARSADQCFPLLLSFTRCLLDGERFAVAILDGRCITKCHPPPPHLTVFDEGR